MCVLACVRARACACARARVCQCACASVSLCVCVCARARAARRMEKLPVSANPDRDPVRELLCVPDSESEAPVGPKAWLTRIVKLLPVTRC